MTTKILEILRSEGVLSDSTGRLVHNYMNRWKISGYTALLDTHIFNEAYLADILARTLRIVRIYNVLSIGTNKEVCDLLPYKEAITRCCMPVSWVGNNKDTVEILFCDPTDDQNIEEVKKIMGCNLNLAVAERSEIIDAINNGYPIEAQIPEIGEQ